MSEVKKRAQGIYPVGSNTHFLYGKVFCGICDEPCTCITVTMKPVQAVESMAVPWQGEGEWL